MAFDLQPLPRQTTHDLREITASNILRSAINGDSMVRHRMGDRWAMDVNVPAVDAANCGPGLVADLVRGKKEAVRVPVPEHFPAENYGATPTVNGSAAGTSLPIKGLTPGVLIRKGKWLNVIYGSQRFLYQTAAEVTANGSGIATLTLTQMLRRPGVNGHQIILNKPVIEGLIPPGQSWSMGSLPAIGVSFSIEEVA
ncbi:hypothetical protein [Brevundimonas sp. DS20]|uniref:hypothetical protein n=1 Tax=Brevundimonas sp. DS20 TaxID=1532555 RepID=UPI0006D060E8|nr:hypothetical protein [Brevundimonas sp. DS20]ALJ08229.1 hypothetical protein JL11_07655 [Brevundimonas sp. DS20]